MSSLTFTRFFADDRLRSYFIRFGGAPYGAKTKKQHHKENNPNEKKKLNLQAKKKEIYISTSVEKKAQHIVHHAQCNDKYNNVLVNTMINTTMFLSTQCSC